MNYLLNHTIIRAGQIYRVRSLTVKETLWGKAKWTKYEWTSPYMKCLKLRAYVLQKVPKTDDNKSMYITNLAHAYKDTQSSD